MCFTTDWLIHLAVLAIIIVAAVAIFQVVLAQFPGIFSGPFAQIIRIVIWAIIGICILLFLAGLIQCAAGSHILH